VEFGQTHVEQSCLDGAFSPADAATLGLIVTHRDGRRDVQVARHFTTYGIRNILESTASHRSARVRLLRECAQGTVSHTGKVQLLHYAVPASSLLIGTESGEWVTLFTLALDGHPYVTMLVHRGLMHCGDLAGINHKCHCCKAVNDVRDRAQAAAVQAARAPAPAPSSYDEAEAGASASASASASAQQERPRAKFAKSLKSMCRAMARCFFCCVPIGGRTDQATSVQPPKPPLKLANAALPANRPSLAQLADALVAALDLAAVGQPAFLPTWQNASSQIAAVRADDFALNGLCAALRAGAGLAPAACSQTLGNGVNSSLLSVARLFGTGMRAIDEDKHVHTHAIEARRDAELDKGSAQTLLLVRHDLARLHERLKSRSGEEADQLRAAAEELKSRLRECESSAREQHEAAHEELAEIKARHAMEVAALQQQVRLLESQLAAERRLRTTGLVISPDAMHRMASESWQRIISETGPHDQRLAAAAAKSAATKHANALARIAGGTQTEDEAATEADAEVDGQVAAAEPVTEVAMEMAAEPVTAAGAEAEVLGEAVEVGINSGASSAQAQGEPETKRKRAPAVENETAGLGVSSRGRARKGKVTWKSA
jgi:hypothetical protein